jgi:hypothetical protein
MGLDPLTVYSFDGQSHAIFHSTTFPRGDEDFRLRLYERQPDRSWSAVAEFPVKNPKRQTRIASWKAEPLPSTNRVEGVPFVLLDLKTGLVARRLPAQPQQAGEWEGAALKWQLPSSQAGSVDWELADFKGISDAFGQKAGRGGYSSSLQNNGEYLVCVDGGLCVEEPVWKVEAEFARRRNFPANELWTIPGIAVPSESEATVVNLITNFGGANIQLMAISGAKCLTPRIRRSLSNRPIVHVICANVPAAATFNLVRVVDEAGREVLDGSRSTDGPEYAFGLKSLGGAKTLDLTFALTKRVAVSYYVKPTRATPAELKKLN